MIPFCLDVHFAPWPSRQNKNTRTEPVSSRHVHYYDWCLQRSSPALEPLHLKQLVTVAWYPATGSMLHIQLKIEVRKVMMAECTLNMVIDLSYPDARRSLQN
jgi:hypothetical protein